MNRRLQACLVSLMMAAIADAVFAQSGVNVPLQRGVSVQLAVTSNAVAVPNADKQDALVVALTADGSAYLGVDLLPTPALADRVRSIFSTQKEKTLSVKADARAPYARLIEVIDAVRKSGVEGLTFLTAQRDAADQGTLVPSKGLEMRVVQPEATSQRNQRR
jgi:biopolymer transport protein TolR